MIEASLNIPDEKISEVQVMKDGVVVQTKEEQSHSKISINRKVSTASEKETVVQLEIENAKPEDEGKCTMCIALHCTCAFAFQFTL